MPEGALVAVVGLDEGEDPDPTEAAGDVVDVAAEADGVDGPVTGFVSLDDRAGASGFADALGVLVAVPAVVPDDAGLPGAGDAAEEDVVAGPGVRVPDEAADGGVTGLPEDTEEEEGADDEAVADEADAAEVGPGSGVAVEDEPEPVTRAPGADDVAPEPLAGADKGVSPRFTPPGPVEDVLAAGLVDDGEVGDETLEDADDDATAGFDEAGASLPADAPADGVEADDEEPGPVCVVEVLSDGVVVVGACFADDGAESDGCEPVTGAPAAAVPAVGLPVAVLSSGFFLSSSLTGLFFSALRSIVWPRAFFGPDRRGRLVMASAPLCLLLMTKQAHRGRLEAPRIVSPYSSFIRAAHASLNAAFLQLGAGRHSKSEESVFACEICPRCLSNG